jgi:regulator of protease activity HflC (stomatin/prohibitin superfamily)
MSNLDKLIIWLILAVLLGMIIGGCGVYLFNKYQLGIATRLGGIIYEDSIYNITKRP